MVFMVAVLLGSLLMPSVSEARDVPSANLGSEKIDLSSLLPSCPPPPSPPSCPPPPAPTDTPTYTSPAYTSPSPPAGGY